MKIYSKRLSDRTLDTDFQLIPEPLALCFWFLLIKAHYFPKMPNQNTEWIKIWLELWEKSHTLIGSLAVSRRGLLYPARAHIFQGLSTPNCTKFARPTHTLGLDRTGHISFLTGQNWTPKFTGQVLPDRTESGLIFLNILPNK